jgi:vacuolar protein sorting-associated protein 33A
MARMHTDDSLGRKFLIATTGIVSGASIIEGMAGIGRATSGPKDAGI